MPESLGARLRRRREEQRIALSTIAERTKIKSALLEALERDDVSHWPAGIYRRAFIRSYAHAIGLDPDPVVREFLELYPDPEEAVAEAPPPPGGLRGVVGLALGSLARLGGRTITPDTPVPARIGTLNLHEPAVRQASQAGAGPMSVPPEVRQDMPTAELSGEPLDVLFDPALAPAVGPDSDALVNDVEAHVDPIVAPVQPIAPEPRGFEPDLMAIARTCTGFARAGTAADLPPLLASSAAMLGASGLIVWAWDPVLEALRPVLAHGYPAKVLAQLPAVGRDDDNATAAAFRTAEPCAIRGTAEAHGALVVPLMTAAGPSGALAIELPEGREQQATATAVAKILAAMLAPLISTARAADSEPRQDTLVDTPLVPPASFRARIARP